MSDKDTDPKNGDETPSGDGQPEKKQPTDEKVEVSKSELEKLQKKSQDFDGIVEAKKNKDRAGRTIPGEEPKKDKDDNNDDDDLEEEFVTKKDFQNQIEKSAVIEICKENPIVDEHYDEVLEFLIFRPGERNTVEGIKAAFGRASKVYKSEHPSPKEVKEDAGAKATADLATENGLGKGKEKTPETKKKSILPKNEKMSEWYGK